MNERGDAPIRRWRWALGLAWGAALLQLAAAYTAGAVRGRIVFSAVDAIWMAPLANSGVFLAVAAIFWIVARGRRSDFATRATLSALLFVFIAEFALIMPGLQEYRPRPTSANAPNVHLIVLDTVRASNLSTDGYARPTSPNFDRLASTGRDLVKDDAAHGSLTQARARLDKAVAQPIPQQARQ